MSSLKPAFEQLPETQLKSLNISFGTAWYSLNDAEAKELLKWLVLLGKTDCGKINNIQDGKDYWNNSINIEIRRRENGSVEIRLRSNGPDAQENTEDDILIVPNSDQSSVSSSKVRRIRKQ